jgi:Cu(I)/Ag(I) efflux system protein CusF
MNPRYKIAMAATILACGTALAADMPGMKLDKPAGTAREMQRAHHAMGVVKAVDAAKGTITLSHEPVPAIQWPAMTMPFKANKTLITSVKTGDRVNFECVANGMDATITSIAKVK